MNTARAPLVFILFLALTARSMEEGAWGLRVAEIAEELGVPHPRNYGTVPRVLGHYVRDEGVLEPEDAVRKMTSLPAQILAIADRGQVRSSGDCLRI